MAPTGALLDIIRRLDDDVDVIVSGHTHQFTNSLIPNAHGKSMLVVQAWSYATAFDDIDVWVDPMSQDVVAKRAQVVTAWDDEGPGSSPDPAVAALIARADARVASRVEQVLAQAEAPIERTTNAAGESALGDLIADAQRDIAGADFALLNPGGIRADLPAGTITWGAAFAVQPFGNDILTLTLTGQDLVDVMNEQWGHGQPSGGRILSISGFAYSWNGSIPDGGSRVVEVHDLHGIPIAASRSYTLAVNQFLAEGGDGFSTLQRLKRSDTGHIDRDALVEYLKKSPRPLSPPTLQRIVLVFRPPLR